LGHFHFPVQKARQFVATSFLTPTMACEATLLWANACVQADAIGSCGPCFDADDSFMKNFPSEVEAQFLSTIAILPPSDPDFCDLANKRVCNYYEKEQVCIDLAEIEGRGDKI
jgi:hypothetical protein